MPPFVPLWQILKNPSHPIEPVTELLETIGNIANLLQKFDSYQALQKDNDVSRLCKTTALLYQEEVRALRIEFQLFRLNVGHFINVTSSAWLEKTSIADCIQAFHVEVFEHKLASFLSRAASIATHVLEFRKFKVFDSLRKRIFELAIKVATILGISATRMQFFDSSQPVVLASSVGWLSGGFIPAALGILGGAIYYWYAEYPLLCAKLFEGCSKKLLATPICNETINSLPPASLQHLSLLRMSLNLMDVD
jgi:hypothetical protein